MPLPTEFFDVVSRQFALFFPALRVCQTTPPCALKWTIFFVYLCYLQRSLCSRFFFFFWLCCHGSGPAYLHITHSYLGPLKWLNRCFFFTEGWLNSQVFHTLTGALVGRWPGQLSWQCIWDYYLPVLFYYCKC